MNRLGKQPYQVASSWVKPCLQNRTCEKYEGGAVFGKQNVTWNVSFCATGAEIIRDRECPCLYGIQEFTRRMPITISGSSEFLARVSDNDVQEQFLAEVQRTVSRKSLLQGFLT